MEIVPIISILIAEYVGDFLLQDRNMALNKSSKIEYLLLHIFYISSSLLIGFALLSVFYLVNVITVLKFVFAYCLMHGMQDWLIWRMYSWLIRMRYSCLDSNNNVFTDEEAVQLYIKNREYAEDKLFYDIMGLDRLLHVITLIALFSVFFYF